jgi:endonuclease YncB( thermonuclease family)
VSEKLTTRKMLPHGQQRRPSALPLTWRQRLSLSIAMLLVGASAAAEPILGRASVIDGDTIEIDSLRIRFDGIDAPESWQRCQDAAGRDYRCGAVAANELDAFLAASRPTACRQVSRDRFRRVVAVCRRADGEDVGSWLVRNGHALDWPKYSKGRYAAEQRAAETSKSGMWVGSFVTPWEARANR